MSLGQPIGPKLTTAHSGAGGVAGIVGAGAAWAVSAGASNDKLKATAANNAQAAIAFLMLLTVITVFGFALALLFTYIVLMLEYTSRPLNKQVLALTGASQKPVAKLMRFLL
jgi:hypothetical protein